MLRKKISELEKIQEYSKSYHKGDKSIVNYAFYLTSKGLRNDILNEIKRIATDSVCSESIKRSVGVTPIIKILNRVLKEKKGAPEELGKLKEGIASLNKQHEQFLESFSFGIREVIFEAIANATRAVMKDVVKEELAKRHEDTDKVEKLTEKNIRAIMNAVNCDKEKMGYMKAMKQRKSPCRLLIQYTHQVLVFKIFQDVELEEQLIKKINEKFSIYHKELIFEEVHPEELPLIIRHANENSEGSGTGMLQIVMCLKENLNKLYDKKNEPLFKVYNEDGKGITRLVIPFSYILEKFNLDKFRDDGFPIDRRQR